MSEQVDRPSASLSRRAETSFGGECPGDIVVELAGATVAALLLRGVIDVSATFGSIPRRGLVTEPRQPDQG